MYIYIFIGRFFIHLTCLTQHLGHTLM